ncbi:MAG: hypothetical protein A2418_03045 [Candidatus Brennerbacteria bacterium RIFOXYC1_FULL_41_11]|uniref:Translation elongation factor-like protein n=1 Tax=Candidatus Brennerbacteria bacterium RIFOXYD1_FULL_41_16 TaxID=1797529 RepID=A0A1G1XKV4_9BACT|nr:MAG: hypothetical protein A2391_00650 [Candidatus Brennerbacteria bacterium RIFOXYB1_FULL_41_13]OGY39811.1 MAG: hypothetical protein A2418_03045 [Candidatus Brennerbacteria bacterium RIFOXYC1_FULL_41_11]OGY40591.1 MAG: hypothetical protein A2570_02555 [Candidatus Brennerbacteria bacterium RIFOXYD1_FULL_41_16]
MAKKIGIVIHVFGKISVAILKLESELKVGDSIQFKGKHTDFTQAIESIQVNHEQIQKAQKGDDVGVKTTQSVEEGDEVFLAE